MDPDALQYASKTLRGCREVVAAAVSRAGETLQFAEPNLWEDRELLWSAVSADGRLLRLAQSQDKELVLTAVRQEGRERQEGIELQDDAEVVMAAIKFDGLALQFASPRLREERVVREAVNRTPRSLMLALGRGRTA
eukprot:g3272.t1